MKRTYLLLLATIFGATSIFAQATHVFTDSEKKFKAVKDLFIQKQYALAYPLLEELRQQYPENKKSDNVYLNDDVNYYFIVCRLKLGVEIAATEAQHYIEWVNNQPRLELMSYHLGKYYFTNNDFSQAIKYYDQAGLANLSNDEMADAKFETAYCYFNLKRLNEAKPLFDAIRQLPSNKYFMAANYYYGFISYYDRNYAQALSAFKVVQKDDAYKTIVPYYIAEINYFQNKKDEALQYAESVISNGNLFYEKEMRLLIGQIYFEKKDYSKALPLLEYYINNSSKVSKENLYELSYCYYETKQLSKAIEGFKQLSNERDSMGQNSMYLLGDCYLRTNQKPLARTAFQYCAINSSNKMQQEISRFNYAKLSYELGYQDVALTEMQSFLKDYPNSIYVAETKEVLVSLLANTNNFKDALTLYESFERHTNTMQMVYPRILFGRAVEYMNDQQFSKADELFTEILDLPKSRITGYANFWKGEIALRQGDYDAAIRQLSSFLLSNSPALGEANTAAAKYNLGYSYMKLEKFKEAASNFDALAKIGSTASAIEQDAYLRSADCYFMLKDFTKANSMYETAISNSLPQSDYAMYQKAMIAGIKNPSAKISLLNNLSRIYPQSNLVTEATLEVANTYMADEKFKEAIPFLNTILKDNNAGGLKPIAYLKLGLSYYNLDDNTQALSNYQKLIELYPQSTEADEALENIKNIYVELGKPNEYVALMRKNGKSISTSEADGLTYAAAELKYHNNDCSEAIAGFDNYLNEFADGKFVLEANFYRSECLVKSKEWNKALIGYNFINNKGLNKFFERSTLAASRINYFELKDYAAAKKNFDALKAGAVNQDNQLEALRGILRCDYQLKDYVQANEVAKALLQKKGISTDDRSIAFLVLGKSLQTNNDCANAIAAFKSCAAINKSAWGAEARYEIANCQFSLGNYSASEKAAQLVIKETGSYDFWLTKSYILLGDIFMQQKDYFNAIATFQSVAQNAAIAELKAEAQQKLDIVIEVEKGQSKIN